MSIIKSTKSGTYGMRVLPKIFYDNADLLLWILHTKTVIGV